MGALRGARWSGVRRARPDRRCPRWRATGNRCRPKRGRPLLRGQRPRRSKQACGSSALASVALIWWCGSLWRRMVRSEAGAARLAVVSLVGLALAGALSLASASVSAALALRIDEVGDELLVFHTLAAVLLAASGFGVATHLLATSILGARTRTLAAVGDRGGCGVGGRVPRVGSPRRNGARWHVKCGRARGVRAVVRVDPGCQLLACGATSALVRQPPDHDRIEATGL